MSLKQQQKHQQRRAALGSAQHSLPADRIASRIGTALQLHQGGDLPAAEAIYHEVLRLHPNHPDALHYLGSLHYQRGQLKEAADLMVRSIATAEQQGGKAAFFSNYGLVLHDLGRLEEAVAAYERSLRLRQDYPEALNNLGNTLQAQEKLDEALARYRRAIALQPGYVQAYCNAGAVLKKQERLAEAEEMYRIALKLSPRHAEAHYNLGNTLHAQGRFEEALDHFRSALASKPDYPAIHINWGNVLMDQGKVEEASERFGLALQKEPLNAKAHVNYAAALGDQGKVADAISVYERVCKMMDEGSSHSSEEESVIAHMNLAMERLVSGDFARGLADFEWRHHPASMARPSVHPQSQWRGEPLHGKTILLHWEQGLGDTLHLLRYAPMVRARGGRVVLQVQPCLERLAAAMSPDFEVVAAGRPLPACDVQCPLMSLPFAFGTRPETIPATVPYLRLPAEEMTSADALVWPPDFKVGLVWAGSPSHVKDKLRSLKLPQLAPLLAVPGVHFFSLQVGAVVRQLEEFPEIKNLAPDPENMADTAAKLAHLDLVIAADTSVAHLAGALGKPAWVMVPFNPDWRWLRDREDSSWYPSMRLFRQPKMHDWETVVERLTAALRAASVAYQRDRLS